MSQTQNTQSTHDFEETDRFTEIEGLRAGWHDGEGEAVSALAIREGRRIRDLLKSAHVQCCVFPTIEGGISLEDTADDIEDSFTITINPDGTALVLSFDEDEAEEEHVDVCALPAASEWMTKKFGTA